jgi:hypothetical protein
MKIELPSGAGGNPPRRGRGRPPRVVSQHVAAAARLKQAEEELKRAQADARAAHDRRLRILGVAVRSALDRHPDERFRHELVEWLRATVTSPSDRAEIADLLIEGDKK